MKIYNTESREKEKIVGSTILIYTCGPTIYDYAHIGNFRTYVFEDILRRALKFFGFKVVQVMNLTDIDDKTIKGAIAKNIPLSEFTTPFKEAFFEDLEKLNIERAEHYPEATKYIPYMIEIIQKLLDKGFAYVGSDKSIYFAIKKFPSYGRLSHLNLDELKAGISVNSDEYEKDNASDFVLWKAFDPLRDGQIFWESPFGRGRPGWHIECSAMALKLFGKTIDIHCGGVDNIFPHHENEIAQSEAFTGQKFVKLWAHSYHLIVDGKKMSKSLGNFFTLRDLINRGYLGREVRYLLLQSHYRMQLNFTFEGLDSAKSSLIRIDDFIDRLKSTTDGSGFYKDLKKRDEGFREALADDLNMSQALSHLFELIREVNSLLDKKLLGKEGAQEVLCWLNSIDSVLALFSKKEDLCIPHSVEIALQEREEARKAKNWKVADEKRAFILTEGFIIEDTLQGAKLKRV